MKKLFFLIICLFSSQVFSKNQYHDQIIDAIRNSKLESLKDIFNKTQVSKKEKENYLVFAQEIFERRDYNFKNFENSKISDEFLLYKLKRSKLKQALFFGAEGISILSKIFKYITYVAIFRDIVLDPKISNSMRNILRNSDSKSAFKSEFNRILPDLFDMGSLIFVLNLLSNTNKYFKRESLEELVNDALSIKELIRSQNSEEITGITNS
ncbi:hypothetical protein M1446_03825 [Candidatus Dependentiae bacterium]|nr:hypothetical protein [Candidatus Dependentiae bacterium]